MTKEIENTFLIKISAYCRKTLYRAVWESPDGPVTVYVHAEDYEAARSRLSSVLGNLAYLAPDQAGAIDFSEVHSYAELLRMGTSECEALRIFEVGTAEGAAIEWVERPLFLSTDQTLIAQWVMLLMHRARLAALSIGAVAGDPEEGRGAADLTEGGRKTILKKA